MYSFLAWLSFVTGTYPGSSSPTLGNGGFFRSSPRSPVSTVMNALTLPRWSVSTGLLISATLTPPPALRPPQATPARQPPRSATSGPTDRTPDGSTHQPSA